MSGVVVITLIVTFYCLYKRRRHARLHMVSPYMAEKPLLERSSLDGRVGSSPWSSKNRSLDAGAHQPRVYLSDEPVEAGWMSTGAHSSLCISAT